MSGDNLHGQQPIKFYSEKITLSKVELLEKKLLLGEKVSNLDEKHKEWSRKLSIWSANKIILFYSLILKFYEETFLKIIEKLFGSILKVF